MAPAHFPLPAAAPSPATSKPRSSCHQTGCLRHADLPTRGQELVLHGAPPGEVSPNGRVSPRRGFCSVCFTSLCVSSEGRPTCPSMNYTIVCCAKIWPCLRSLPARSRMTVSVESLCPPWVQTGISPLHPVHQYCFLFAHPRWPPALCQRPVGIVILSTGKHKAFGPDCRWRSGGDIMKGPSESLGLRSL